MTRYGALAVAIGLVLLWGSDYLVHLVLLSGLNSVAALGLALLWGYTGQISIGQAAFYGLGAYASALIALRLPVNPWLGAGIAIAGTSVVAWGLGWLVFRLRGHHLAMATLGFGIIVNIGFVELRDLTGGPNGLASIPPLRAFGVAIDAASSACSLIWLVCIGAIVVTENLLRSPLGLALRAVGESERVASSVGVDPAAIKRAIFALAAAFAATSGAVYAHYLGYVSPGPFDVELSIRLLLMVAIGGFARIWGVLFGVAFVTLLGELIKPLGSYDVALMGLLLVVTILYCPRGVLQRLVELRSRKRPAVLPEQAS